MDALYQLNLRALGSEPVQKQFVLQDNFFENLDQTEVQGGAVRVTLSVRPKAGVFQLNMHLCGEVKVACDRCLETVTVPIETDDEVRIRLGEETNEETEPMEIAEYPGVYDYAWRMYESIVLALPLERVHEEGECNPEMLDILKAHSASPVENEE